MRPEHTRIGGEGGWPVKVEMVEMLGAERLVHCRLGPDLFTVRVEGTTAPCRIGDSVRLQPQAVQVHWFDAASQRRVES